MKIKRRLVGLRNSTKKAELFREILSESIPYITQLVMFEEQGTIEGMYLSLLKTKTNKQLAASIASMFQIMKSSGGICKFLSKEN